MMLFFSFTYLSKKFTSLSSTMPHRRRMRRRKSKFVTKRGLPFQLMKYAEVKKHDEIFIQEDLTVIATTGNHRQLLDINQGLDIQNRIGNMVQCTGFYIRVMFESVLTGSMQWIRIAVTTPRDTNNTSSPIFNSHTPIDTDVWKVWYDKTHPCPFVPGGGGGVVTIRKKFRPYLKVIYSSGLGGSIEKGRIQMTAIPFNNLGTRMNATARVYFRDL